ncbi:hypothetical protein OG339_07280 [Streptosporangium sp. NBC_01495]|uniref:hypothetical protein n=1 Tax=Streptosporangium sp. NBC_01495 TaxID=2903899 RepID=UPI002E366E52|nr:hypothetical protein [Streptosporangium sp. NBC_01495]
MINSVNRADPTCRRCPWRLAGTGPKIGRVAGRRLVPHRGSVVAEGQIFGSGCQGRQRGTELAEVILTERIREAFDVDTDIDDLFDEAGIERMATG